VASSPCPDLNLIHYIWRDDLKNGAYPLMSSSVLPFVSSPNINTTATISSITSVNIMNILQNPMLLPARLIAPAHIRQNR